MPEGGGDRSALLARLGRLKQEIRQLKKQLGLTEPVDLPAFPAPVESTVGQLITEYSADLLSVHSAEGDYLYVSPNAERFFGWKSSELIGRSAYELFHQEDLHRIASDHAAHHAAPGETRRVRYRIRAADGGYRWVETRSRSTPAGSHIVCITRDIETEVVAVRRMRKAERQLRSELEEHAYTDALTALPNRRALERELADELSRARRKGTVLSLVLLDIDGFKPVNDRRGHTAGDRLLEEVARILDTSRRSYDRVGRWGGDEFLVVLPETHAAEAARVAGRMCGRVAVETEVTLSGGVASLEEDDTPDDLLRRADEALYRAKQGGRDRVEVDTPEVHASEEE